MDIKQLFTLQPAAAKTIPNNPQHDKLDNPTMYFSNFSFDGTAISLSALLL